jgi:alkane 1-monooxygenase
MVQSRPVPMTAFALVTTSPVALFALAIWAGGMWPLLGLLYMTVLAATLDQIGALFMGNAPEGAEFPAANALLVLIAVTALLMLPLASYAVAVSDLSPATRVFLFIGVGLWLGQVANPAAHELIHRSRRWLFRLGVLVYSVLLFGHHASAHRLVHHRHAASAEDPNSARSGEGFYAFFLRAWAGSFRAGFRAENDLRARATRRGLHPYLVYFGIAAVALGLAFGMAGPAGVAVWAGLALHAQSQLLLSDYVQHYGLTRARRDDGRLEPVADRHSWNAPFWFTSALMLNAPRHSDHHAHPDRPYPALRLPDATEAPRLPWSLPVACVIALVPPLWRRAIRPALAAWKTPAA